MSVMRIIRPVWRKFSTRETRKASEWVRAGGAAVIVENAKRMDMLLGVDENGKITESGLWAILAVEQQRHVKVKEGPARGLASARVGPHAIDAVLDWCDRDVVHDAPTRPLRLDCLACGACCHDANVILYEEDFERFRAAGRRELGSSTYVRRGRDGKVTLRFLKDGRCQHLGPDKKCFIYEHRPHNCRVFPVGSEACLAAREGTLGIRDGAPLPA